MASINVEEPDRTSNKQLANKIMQGGGRTWQDEFAKDEVERELNMEIGRQNDEDPDEVGDLGMQLHQDAPNIYEEEGEDEEEVTPSESSMQHTTEDSTEQAQAAAEQQQPRSPPELSTNFSLTRSTQQTVEADNPHTAMLANLLASIQASSEIPRSAIGKSAARPSLTPIEEANESPNWEGPSPSFPDSRSNIPSIQLVPIAIDEGSLARHSVEDETVGTSKEQQEVASQEVAPQIDPLNMIDGIFEEDYNAGGCTSSRNVSFSESFENGGTSLTFVPLPCGEGEEEHPPKKYMTERSSETVQWEPEPSEGIRDPLIPSLIANSSINIPCEDSKDTEDLLEEDSVSEVDEVERGRHFEREGIIQFPSTPSRGELDHSPRRRSHSEYEPTPSERMPQVATQNGMEDHIHPSRRGQFTLALDLEQIVVTPNPGSPSLSPSSPSSPLPFAYSPLPLQPLNSQGLDEYNPEKPATGVLLPPDGDQQETVALTPPAGHSLPPPMILSPETLNFLAKLQLPAQGPRPQPQPFHTSAIHHHQPDHRNHHTLSHPYSPQLPSSSRPALPPPPFKRPRSPALLDSYRPDYTTHHSNHAANHPDTYRPPPSTTTTDHHHHHAVQLNPSTLSTPLLLAHTLLGSFNHPRSRPQLHTLAHALCPHATLALTRTYAPARPPRPWRAVGGGRGSGGRGGAGAEYVAVGVGGGGAGAQGSFVEGWGVEVVGGGEGCGGECERGERWRVGDWEGLVDEVVEAMVGFMGEREGEAERVGWDRERGQGRARREVKLLLVMGQAGWRSGIKKRGEAERGRKRKVEDEEKASRRRMVDSVKYDGRSAKIRRRL